MKLIKKMMLLVLLTNSINAYAIIFKIFDKCDNTPFLDKELKVDISKTVGEITVEILKTNSIEFIGNAHGVNSINNSPMGIDAMENISDIEFKSFGWCYRINDNVMFDFPDTQRINQQDTITWFFAFAHYYNNEWLKMCSPAYLLTEGIFCD